MSISTSPFAVCRWLTVPLTPAENAEVGVVPPGAVELGCATAPAPALAAEAARATTAGVPARRAQLEPSGPLGSHSAKAAGSAIDAAIALPRNPRRAGQPNPTRAHTATIRAITHPARSASIQSCLMSLPVPTA